MDLVQKQHDLETEMSGAGLAKFIKNLDQAVASGDEAVTPYGKQTMSLIIKPLSDALMALFATQYPQRQGVTLKLLRDMDPMVVAFITAKSAVNSLSETRPLLRASVELGARIEDEQRFTAFEAAHPGLFHTVLRDLKQRTSNTRHQRTVMMQTQSRKTDVDWAAWDTRKKMLVGRRLLELMASSVGIIRIVKRTVKHNDRRFFIEATPAMVDVMHKLHNLLRSKDGVYSRDGAEYSIFTPAYCPTVIPPKPWTDLKDGGYHFAVATRGGTALIKNCPDRTLEDIGNTVDMAGIYKAVNIIQATAWKVNTKVLEVLDAVWQNGNEVGKLPQREATPVPPRDFTLPERPDHRGKMVVDRDALNPEQMEAFTAWKHRSARLHRDNATRAASVLQAISTMDVAHRFAEFPTLYMPQQLDFRGRTYALPMYLNPQGPDYAKALLTFANGKPIEDHNAAGFLMIHGANCFGVDKVSFTDRMAWVEENEAAILEVGADPLAHTWWQDGDEPFQFLAFCLEWSEFKRFGWGYVSHLPVALDGSCNGIQHFSAMLRDERGGRAVNLLDSEVPSDIYQEVANLATAKVQAIADKAGEGQMDDDQVYANEWLQFGIDRALCKRSVMILPYGGTIKACRDYIRKAIAARKTETPWKSEDYGRAAAWLSRHVWSSIDETVVASREAMTWLRKCASLCGTDDGNPISWITPDGFPVIQAYKEMEHYRVNTIMGEGIRIVLQYSEPKDQVYDKHRMRNGISPNFVHSMDACALRSYVLLASALPSPITSFCLVHDSFGTLAADAYESAQANRDAFVSMYQEHDVLAEFATSVAPIASEDLPARPAMGSLDLEDTRIARYFIG